MEKYIFAEDALLTSRKRNYFKNILNIAQLMKQLLLKCHQEILN